MFALARIVTWIFDALVAPFGSHRFAALAVVSTLCGAAFALVFRAASNQAAIARSREVFKARILEMRLYPDDFVLIARAFLGALASQGAYLKHAAGGILVVLVVAVPAFVQVEQRFAAGPLGPGSRALVTATLAPGSDPRTVATSLSGPSGVSIDGRSARVRATREVVWAVDVREAGRFPLELRVGDAGYHFSMEAEPSCRVLGRERTRASLTNSATQLGLPAIAENSALAGVRVAYPDAEYRVAGASLNWLAVFLLGTLAGALLPAWLLKVQL